MATDNNPDQRVRAELEVAETLLQLKGLDKVDTVQDNEELLPVDTPKQDDFTKDMAEAENEHENTANTTNTGIEDDNGDNNDDDDATVIYEPDTPSTMETTPKKGRVTFKHYGIRRHSP